MGLVLFGLLPLGVVLYVVEQIASLFGMSFIA